MPRADLDAARPAERAACAQAARRDRLRDAAHRIGQPLNAMALLADAVQRRTEGRPDIAEMLGAMQDAVGQLERMIRSLLDLARVETAMIQPRVAPFPIASVLMKLEIELQPLAEARGLDFRVVPSAASVVSDPWLVGLILRHFLVNALSYTAKGRVLAGCRRAGGNVDALVLDTGVGVPAGALDGLFRGHGRLEQQPGTEAHGLGVGLAVSARIAHSLGHRITARSEVGRGSVFGLRLPLSFPGPHTG